MRKTILSLLGSTLSVASMAKCGHGGRAHHPTPQNAREQRIRNALAAENRNVFWPKDQNPFGTTNPWPSGIQPDDWRQSVNGGR